MSNGNFMSNIPKRRKKTFRIMKQCFGWRELERHLNRLQKARYCSYLKQQQQQTLNGIGKTCEVFSLCIHCCFNSHFHCTFPSLIFAGFNLLKLQNNREEETLSPFNCGKKRKITRIRWERKRIQPMWVLSIGLMSLAVFFLCAPKGATAVLFIVKVSISLFHIWTRAVLCRHCECSLFVGNFCMPRRLRHP